MNLIEEVKKKKEFSGLPDSVVERALEKSGDDVKEARKWLRKYFGVFLTNRVLRFARNQESGIRNQDVLGAHISSKKRDYKNFYDEIFEVIRDLGGLEVGAPHKTMESSTRMVSRGHLAGGKNAYNKFVVVDLGCGVNGFSFEFLPEGVSYIGIEASGQLVDLTNDFFQEKGFDGKVYCRDLFDLDFVSSILRDIERPSVAFLFQVVDALENMEKDFSKKFISLVMGHVDFLVISLPMVSLGGRKRIGDVKRKWLVDWLEENFVLKKDFEMFEERIICVANKSSASR